MKTLVPILFLALIAVIAHADPINPFGEGVLGGKPGDGTVVDRCEPISLNQPA